MKKVESREGKQAVQGYSVHWRENQDENFFYCLFIYSYVYTLFTPSLPPDPPIPSLLPTSSFPDRTYSALFSNFVEEKT
jgi:hypothetical protein